MLEFFKQFGGSCYQAKEVQALFGITSRTLYNWEKQGILISKRLQANGDRWYPVGQVDRLLGQKPQYRLPRGLSGRKVLILVPGKIMVKQLSLAVAGWMNVKVMTPRVGVGLYFADQGLLHLFYDDPSGKLYQKQRRWELVSSSDRMKQRLVADWWQQGDPQLVGDWVNVKQALIHEPDCQLVLVKSMTTFNRYVRKLLKDLPNWHGRIWAADMESTATLDVQRGLASVRLVLEGEK